MLVAPSILAADFGNLRGEVIDICNAGCDLVHLDIMDGHFVPNLTFGPAVVESFIGDITKPLDIHLMVDNNDFFVELFAPLKPKMLSFHIEIEKHANRLVQKIKSYGIQAGIALNPHSNPDSLIYLLPYIDFVLVMSVNPGFGGQSFIANSLDKIKHLKDLINVINPACQIEVDGGVSNKNILALKESGVNIVVAGSYVFQSDNYAEAIASLRI